MSPPSDNSVRVGRVNSVCSVYAYVGSPVTSKNTCCLSPDAICSDNSINPTMTESRTPSASVFRAEITPMVDSESREEEDVDYSTSMMLLPGERRGWWAEHSEKSTPASIALVYGAICDHRTPILLDSGSSTSMISLDLARRLKLKLKNNDRLTIRGLGDTTTHVTAKAVVKITLGARVTYTMEMWVTNIGEGVQCLLGMDFMVTAGVRMNMHDGSVMLPDEERVLMMNHPRGPPFVKEVSVTNYDPACLMSGEAIMVPISYGDQDPHTLELWIYRSKH